MTKTKAKKIMRRVISITICAVMLFTSCSLFDIWSVISKAAIDISSHELAEAGSGSFFSTYSINMPEIIYMKPGQDFSEYFLNSDSDGTVSQATSNKGTFSFSCSTAKKIRVEARLCSATLGDLSASDPNISSIELSTGATINSFGKNTDTLINEFNSSSFSLKIERLQLSSILYNKEYIIQWTIKYTTSDEKVYTTYAYTGIKCPNVLQAGMVSYSSHQETTFLVGSSTPEQYAYTFITGIDSVSGGNSSSKFMNSSAGLSTYSPSSLIAPLVQFKGSHDKDVSGNYTMPEISHSAVYTYFNQNDYNGGVYVTNSDSDGDQQIWGVSGYDRYSGTNSYSDASGCYANTQTTSGGVTYGYGKGHINIDTSRYTNFNQIPNFRAGYVQFSHKYDTLNFLNTIRNCYYLTSNPDNFMHHNSTGSINSGTSATTNFSSSTIHCNVDRGNVDSGSWVRGLYPFDGEIPKAADSQTIYSTGETNTFKTYIRFEYMNTNKWGGDSAYNANINTVGLTYKCSNKDALRKEYYEYLNSGINTSVSNWSEINTAVRNIVKSLCVQTNTSTTYTDITSKITAAQDELRSDIMAAVTASPMIFIVPEQIYLAPNGTSFKNSTSSEFQYYIQNTITVSDIYNSEITATSTTSTQGNIYFAYTNAEPDSLSITSKNVTAPNGTELTGGSITYAAPTFNTSSKGDYYSTSITAGMSPSLSNTTTGYYIEWTAHFTDINDGYEKIAIAYTYVYKPYVTPVGVGVDAGNKARLGNNHWAGHISWISGVHNIYNETSLTFTDGYDEQNAGTANYYKEDFNFSAFLSKNNVAYADSTRITNGTQDSRGKYYTLFSGTDSSTQPYFKLNPNDNNPGNYMGGSTTGNKFINSNFTFGKFYNNSVNYCMVTVPAKYRGEIYVDQSRYTNLNQIPNLSIGFLVTDNENCDSDAGYWMISDCTGDTSFENKWHDNQSGADSNWLALYNMGTVLTGEYGGTVDYTHGGSEGLRYAGTWNRELNVENTLGNMYRFKGLFSTNSSNGASYKSMGVTFNYLKAHQMNKTNIRLAVKYAISNFPALGIYDSSLNSYFYNGTSSSDFGNFKSYYRTACQVLCKLDGVVSSSYDSTGELDVLAKNLNDAVSNLVNKGNNLKVSGTAHQYHIGLERTNNGQFRAAQIVGAKDVSKSFDARDNLYFTSDSFDGYTFAGAIIVNSTSNIDSLIRNLKTTNNVIDPRGSYISNENYYPASISQSGNSTTFTRSTSHNAYHPTSAKAPETIGADGTITFSWVGNINNASTFGDFSVIYFYYPSQKVLYFDLNDGETAVNMLSSTSYNATNDSFFNFDNKFTYTQNGVTVKYDPLTCTYTFNGTASGDNFWGDSVLPVGFSSSKAYTAQFVVVGGKVQKTASDAENPKGCFVFEGKNSNGEFFTEPNRLNFDLGFAQGVDTKQTNTRSNLNATSVADSKMLNLRFWKNGSNPIYFENYQVKFQFIEGSTPNQKFSPNAKAISANDNVGTLPIPEREGYNFTGWYTEKSGGTRVTSGMIMGSSNRTVYAHWTPVSYHVLLDNEFDVDAYMNTAASDSNLTGYTNAYTNWKRSTDGTYANGTQLATSNATSVMKKTAEGEDYINFNYSYTATGEETFFDHYAFDAFTAENAGTYTADFKYKINDFYSEMQDVYGDDGYASAMLCLTNETKGSLYTDYSTHSENKDVTEGWQSSSLEISNVSAGDRIRFQFVIYFGSDAYPLNAINANVDISHIVIRDGNGRVVWSSDQVSVSQGTGYLDYNAGSLTVKNTATSPTATDVEKDSRADIRAYKMELTAGVSYTLTVNYEAFSDNPTLQMFVFGCSDSNPASYYSGFWNNYVSNITSGRAVITFTPNETYHYVYLGLGSSAKSGGCIEFSKIILAPTYVYDINSSAYNNGISLAGVQSAALQQATSDAFGTFYRGSTSNLSADDYNELITNHYQTVDMNQPYSGLNIPTCADTESGYTFSGWYKADGTKVVNADCSAVNPPVLAETNGLKLYSKWEKTVKLHYNANKPTDASGTVTNIPADQDIYCNTKLKINSTKPYLPGWKFENWQSVSDSSRTFAAGEELSIEETNSIYNSVSSGDTYNVSATWSINKYDLSINPNGGTLAADANGNVTYYSELGSDATLKKYTSAITGTSATQITSSNSKVIYETDDDTKIIAVKAPTRDGNTFNGWKVSTGYGYYSTNKTTWTKISSSNTLCKNGETGVVYFKCIGGQSDTDTSVTLIADWKIHTFVTFYMSNLDESDTSTFHPTGAYDHDSSVLHNYGESFSIYSDNTPTSITGKEFLGYSETKGFTGKLYQPGDTVDSATAISWYNEVGNNGTKYLYAVWYSHADFDDVEDIDNDEDIEVVTGIVLNSSGKYSSDLVEYVSPYTDASYTALRNTYNSYLVAKSAYEANPTNITIGNLYTAIEALQAAQKNLVTNPIETKYLNDFTIQNSNGSKTEHLSLDKMNLNHYTKTVLTTALLYKTEAQDYIDNSDDYDIEDDQDAVNTCLRNMAKAYINKGNYDTTKPQVDVYETPTAVKEQLKSNTDIDAVHFVYTIGKGYTYYCYTNKTNPTIVLNITDPADSAHGSRVSYPTGATVTSNTITNATTLKGYYQESKVNAPIGSNFVYKQYTSGPVTIGTNPNDSGVNYYKQMTQIKLTPKFEGVRKIDMAEFEYNIMGNDDSYIQNYTDKAWLYGTNETTTVAAGENITIVVSYHYSEKEAGESEASLRCDFLAYPNGYDSWCNQFRMQRLSGGANNWELIIKGSANSAVYNVFDPTFGKQCDYGCLVYEFAGVDNTENIPESCIKIDKSNINSEANLNHLKDIVNNKQDQLYHMDWPRTIGYSEWPANWSFCLYPYPSNNMYVYVHLIDRWGNTFDEISYVQPIDPEFPSLNATKAGEVMVNETGGSGVKFINLNCSSYSFVTDEDTTYQDGILKTPENDVKISTGKPNTTFTLTVSDNAYNETTASVKTDSSGNLKITVNDDAYTYNGVYSFKFNKDIINLFCGILKYIHTVKCNPVEIGDSSLIEVVTKSSVNKIQIVDSGGNTTTVSSCSSEDIHTETKTWLYNRTKGLGSYTYTIKAKVGSNWLDENKKVTLTVTPAQLVPSGIIRYVKYTPASVLNNTFTVRVTGRPSRIQFIDSLGRSRVFSRTSSAVSSIKSYNANGTSVMDNARSLVYEIWTINASLPTGEYKASGKFDSEFNMSSNAIYSFDVKLK